MKERRKVGELYLNMATKALDYYYPNMGDKGKQVLLMRRNLSEIERYVPIVRILTKVAHKVSKILLSTGVVLPPELLWELIYQDSEEIEEGLKESLAAIAARMLTDHYQTVTVLLVLEEAHNEWQNVYEDWFFDPAHTHERSRFLPFELIGPEQAMFYQIYTRDLLSLLGIKMLPDRLKRQYLQWQEEFLKGNGLLMRRYAVSALTDYLMRGTYSLPPKIAAVVRSDRDIAMKMASS